MEFLEFDHRVRRKKIYYFYLQIGDDVTNLNLNY